MTLLNRLGCGSSQRCSTGKGLALRGFSRKLGTFSAAPVRKAAKRRPPGEARAHTVAPYAGQAAGARHDSLAGQHRPVRARRTASRRHSLRSAALTSLIVLAGFGAVTPLILLAALNPPAASVASDKRGEITASIAPVSEPAADPAAILPDVKVEPSAAAKADVVPVTEMPTSDINPPIYVPAALPGPDASRTDPVPQPAAGAPRGVISMHVKAPGADEAPRADVLIAEAPGPQPAEAVSEKPRESETQIAKLESVPEGLTAAEAPETDPVEPANEQELEEGVAPAEEPEGSTAADEDGGEEDAASGDTEAEKTETAITKPRPKPAKIAAKKPAKSSRTASVKSAVNMRSKPSKGGSVLTVIPRGSQIQVIDCKYWCNVEYKGKRGWVAKSFIRGATS